MIQVPQYSRGNHPVIIFLQPFTPDGLMDRYRQIVELSEDCVKELDLAGTVVAINDNGLKLFRAQQPSDMLGRKWKALWPLATQSLVEHALSAALRGEKAGFEASALDGQGMLRDWRVRVGPLRDDGRIIGVLAVSSDVTARNAALAAADVLGAGFDAKADEAGALLANAATREATLINTLRESQSRLLATNLAYQELEVRHFQVSQGRDFAVAAQRAAELIAEHAQKGEAVGQLLAGVVHDLNNFLHSATTAIDLVMASGELGPKNTGLLTVAEAALEQGAEMSQRLIGFARQHPYRPEAVELAAMVTKMEPLLHQAVGQGIELVVDPGDSTCCAMVDRNTLERALLNLVVNARDACTSGDTIRVTTGHRVVPGDDSSTARVPGSYLTLCVSDTGCGMSEEVMARVFEVYFTTKPPGEGSGLGLPQVHSAVRQAGGFVTITSAPGEGATFELALPRVMGDSAS
jgi:PAS domain S-box-containing protein